MTRKQKRLTGIFGIGLVLGLALMLVAIGLQDEITFYRTPTEVAELNDKIIDEQIRLGGLVEEGSVDIIDTKVKFTVRDSDHAIAVNYDGILPDLFREGQLVIVEGAMVADGSFSASTVLAKHDENYIPKEMEGMMEEMKGEGAQ